MDNKKAEAIIKAVEKESFWDILELVTGEEEKRFIIKLLVEKQTNINHIKKFLE